MIINNNQYAGFRVYKRKRSEEYAYIWENEKIGLFVEPCYGDLPSVHSDFCPIYLESAYYPVSFSKLPDRIKKHLLNYLKD